MTGDAVFDAGLSDGLVWQPALGMGFYPVREADEPYRAGETAEAYWAKYEGYARTPLGEQITAARVAFVRERTTSSVVDVGIGCGAFVEAMYAAGGEAFGCDVSPVATVWLKDRGIWRSPWEQPVDVVTLWDVLEHLPDPAAMLANVRRWAFVSLPIFGAAEDVLASRHFRPDEHRWYWTADGLVGWMAAQGFECAARDDFESRLGREAIETFAFRRTG